MTDMGKGSEKPGGLEGAGAVEPRWTLGHASLLGSWEDACWREGRGGGEQADLV